MELFIKTCGIVLLTVILMLALGSRSKEQAMVLGIAVCAMGALAALEYLRPVIDFISQAEQIGGLDHSLIKILLKVVGIGLISEIAALVCTDGGSSSLGKAVKLLGSAVVLWLSIPLYSMLMELLQRILGDL